MKKLVISVLLSISLLLSFASCGANSQEKESQEKEDVIEVVDGYVVVNGVKTEHEVKTEDKVEIVDGYLVVNGVKTEHMHCPICSSRWICLFMPVV